MTPQEEEQWIQIRGLRGPFFYTASSNQPTWELVVHKRVNNRAKNFFNIFILLHGRNSTFSKELQILLSFYEKRFDNTVGQYFRSDIIFSST